MSSHWEQLGSRDKELPILETKALAQWRNRVRRDPLIMQVENRREIIGLPQFYVIQTGYGYQGLGP